MKHYIQFKIVHLYHKWKKAAESSVLIPLTLLLHSLHSDMPTKIFNKSSSKNLFIQHVKTEITIPWNYYIYAYIL